MPNSTSDVQVDAIRAESPNFSPENSRLSRKSNKPTLAPIEDAIALIAPELERVELELKSLLQSTIAIIPRVGGHLAFAGGKRFRPVLSLLAAQAVNRLDPEAITLAAVGELLHTATLLHDDVVDSGDFRRGRPSARYHYGNGLAVLTGDYCLARALQAVAEIGDIQSVKSLATTVTRMAEGEIAQLHVAGDWAMDRDRYYMVIDRKTAALMSWCSSLGSRVGDTYRNNLEQFGLELGYAFQISDDIIDYTQDIGHSGKAMGQDLRDGKITLPLLLACEKNPDLRGRLRTLMRPGVALSETDSDEISAIVHKGGALDATRKIAHDHARKAVHSLQFLPDCPAREALVDLATHVASRSQ